MSTQIPYGIVYITSRVFRGEVVKRYVGQHRLLDGKIDDGYLGSGNLIRRALKKYGKECFTREILQVCYSREDLDAAEIAWISHFDATRDPLFYNIVSGGRAGFGEMLRKKVYQYSLDGHYLTSFESVVAAASFIGCAEAQMTEACRSERRTAHGFQWRFYKKKYITPARRGHDRAVSCFTLLGEFIANFDTIKEAAAFCGVMCGANITSVCRGKRREAGGFQWKYANDQKVIEALPPKRKSDKPVVQIDPNTFEVVASYNSRTEAAHNLGGSIGNLTRSITQGYAFKGYLWKNKDV